MESNDEIYKRVTNLMAARVNQIFESEDSLKEEFLKRFPGISFNRTDHWGSILYVLLRDCWLEAGPEVKAEPTGYDRNVILKRITPLLDYNLFTQVMLNLQSYLGMAYQALNAEKDLKTMEEGWKNASRSPFSPGSKMVKISANMTTEDEKFNHDLSTIRSLKIIANFTPNLSWRVSPKGSTPALVDSNNVSSLGIGADRYLKVMPGLRASYVFWEPGSGPTMATIPPASSDHITFQAEGIPYPFRSKSGGEILNQVLFSRRLAFNIFCAHDVTQETCIIIPRMSSILVVHDDNSYNLRHAIEPYLDGGVIQLAEGSRSDPIQKV